MGSQVDTKEKLQTSYNRLQRHICPGMSEMGVKYAIPITRSNPLISDDDIDVDVDE